MKNKALIAHDGGRVIGRIHLQRYQLSGVYILGSAAPLLPGNERSYVLANLAVG